MRPEELASRGGLVGTLLTELPLNLSDNLRALFVLSASHRNDGPMASFQGCGLVYTFGL